MVRKLFHQDYSKLKRLCQQRNHLFEDPDFPATRDSLFYSANKSDAHIEWKRPNDISDDPRLVVDGLDPSDLNQGELGNCWFVAACSALALDKKHWDKVVPDADEQEWDEQDSERYYGIFRFRFWHFGEWVEVVVDDQLPTKYGQLLFMKSKSKSEFWSALLEKAYAKLAGSYEALSGGHTSDALIDFTGGVSETVFIADEGYADDEAKSKTLFKTLFQAHVHKAMISCAIALSAGDSPEAELSCGLVKGHAYTVTDIRKMKLGTGLRSLFGNREKLRMIKMRNPWGQKEWNGPWSDQSDEWSRVSASEKRSMGLVVEDDGEFWMEFSDWCHWFSQVSICQVINTSHVSFHKTWHEKVYHGKWQGRSAGGCVNHRDTFLRNPQFTFHVTHDEEEVMVSLMQKDSRKSRSEGGEGNFSIGCFIMKVEENLHYRLHTIHQKAASTTYINSRSVFGRFTFPEGRYVIVPSTFDPGQEREFLLRIFTARDSHVVELKHDSPDRGVAAFLCCCCIKPPTGLVSVHVDSASGLAKQDITGAGADPYCKVSCEGKTVLTPVCRNTLEPNFDSTVLFYVKNPLDCNVKIQVYNRRIIADRFMGQVTSGLGPADGSGKRHTLRLMEKGRHANTETQGTITFTIHHYANLRAV